MAILMAIGTYIDHRGIEWPRYRDHLVDLLKSYGHGAGPVDRANRENRRATFKLISSRTVWSIRNVNVGRWVVAIWVSRTTNQVYESVPWLNMRYRAKGMGRKTRERTLLAQYLIPHRTIRQARKAYRAGKSNASGYRAVAVALNASPAPLGYHTFRALYRAVAGKSVSTATFGRIMGKMGAVKMAPGSYVLPSRFEYLPSRPPKMVDRGTFGQMGSKPSPWALKSIRAVAGKKAKAWPSRPRGRAVAMVNVANVTVGPSRSTSGLNVAGMGMEMRPVAGGSMLAPVFTWNGRDVPVVGQWSPAIPIK